MSSLHRRDFLQTSFAAAASLALARVPACAADDPAFSFVLLGDLHYDKLEHHDMAWLEKNKAGDLSQIKNYSRITAEIMPRLFTTVRETIAELNRTPETRVSFVLQVGDLVEGLCGTEELSARQNREALDFVRGAKLGVPFLFTKGNHDVTGDGATEAFRHVFDPYLTEQNAPFRGTKPSAGACYTFEQSGALFCCYDAYDKTSLDWLEAALAKRTAKNCFVTIHPPVVPYGARATWYLYSSDRDRSKREKLLELLGKNEAFVLGGHIHKFNTITRTTGSNGRFTQLAVSSVIGAPEVKPKDVLAGLAEYNGDQIRVEPSHSPGTAPERRAVYDAERPFVRAFDYADLPGYAVITVRGAGVQARIYSGISRSLWRTVDLSGMLRA
jgi:hypothetical protein